jgi:hypothetical protein
VKYPKLSAANWRDVHDALMDAAEAHHSGERADHYAALAKRLGKAFSAADWQLVYEGLVDAAAVHHSGPRADRYSALARKVLAR